MGRGNSENENALDRLLCLSVADTAWIDADGIGDGRSALIAKSWVDRDLISAAHLCHSRRIITRRQERSMNARVRPVDAVVAQVLPPQLQRPCGTVAGRCVRTSCPAVVESVGATLALEDAAFTTC